MKNICYIILWDTGTILFGVMVIIIVILWYFFDYFIIRKLGLNVIILNLICNNCCRN